MQSGLLETQTPSQSFQHLAILFFNQEYRSSRYRDLPGVEKDRIELTGLLSEFSEYHQIEVKNSENVLLDLQHHIEQQKEEKYERVHFHYSGIY